MPPELRAALDAARRRTRRDRLRTLAWRWRAPLGPVLVVAVAVAAWQAWPGPGPGPRMAANAPMATMRLHARAIDGDTLASGTLRLRLHAIDAPELRQTCIREGRPYACGEDAHRAMARLLGNGALTCEGLDTDRYGRRIARCTNADGQDIAAALVAEGWAIAFRRFGEDYVPQEEQARRGRRGIWAGSFEAPAEYRARQAP